MAKVQLLFNDEGNTHALASLVDKHHTSVIDQELRECDLYIVDEAVFPQYRNELIAQKHEQRPGFCPVVLIRRERAPITVNLPDPITGNPPLLVNAVMKAPIGKQALFRTISNLLARRRQTEGLTTELWERNKRLEQFARTLRHELRNPLTVVNGYLEIAREEGDPESFEVCQEYLDQMNQLLEDTLLIIDGGELEYKPEPVDLAATCNGCWKVVSAEEAQLEIGEINQIRADEVRLKQLLENVFRNAVEHVGPTVTVTVGEIADGFYIEDDGMGIPQKERNRVFEEGYSGDSAGTGIGLSVVESVVDLHGWNVRVDQSEGGGARFEITGVNRVSDEVAK